MGLYRDNGKEYGNYYNGLYRDYRVYIGLYWGYIGIMEKKMETTTILGYMGDYKVYIYIYIWVIWGIIGYILGLYWDNGKEHGKYRAFRGDIGVIGYLFNKE